MLNFILIFSLLTQSYSFEGKTQDNDILTSYAWVKDDGRQDHKEVYTFYRNGQYITELGEIKTFGKWLWTSKNEIFMLHGGLQIDTLSIHIQEGLGSSSQGFYVRIIEINDKELKTLERYEGDSWDSGFAREQRYIAKLLTMRNEPQQLRDNDLH